MTEQSGTSGQFISLPGGGGAIKGLGESFVPDIQTGTGQFSVPLAIPPGRNGLQPTLALTYSTAAGNGPLGLGWSVGIPAVARKTSKGVPLYHSPSAPLRERDTFVFAGGEDLVPVLEDPSQSRYRPRTERLFEKVVHQHGQAHDYWEI